MESLPIDKKIASKDWAARVQAFDELNTLYESSNPLSQDEIFTSFAGNWDRYLKDTNAKVLEKVIQCLKSFVDKVHPDILVKH